MYREELVKELVAASAALVSVWGSRIRTSAGSLSKVGGAYIISPELHSWDSITVYTDGYARGRVNNEPTIEELMSAASWLGSLAVFLASKDFTDKIEGSISRLKRLTKALE